MPSPAQPAVGACPATVVIATRDRPAMLQRCLRAVVAALRPTDSVVVVDSASTSTAVRRVAEDGGARVLRCERPGTCRARNAGWRAATTELVLFTDDDCAPATDWVRVTAGLFDAAPELSFVTGAVHPDATNTGRAQLATSLLTDGTRRAYGGGGVRGTGRGGNGDLVGHGANMAWRRGALQAIGGFDEALGPGATFRGAEDHDAFVRALHAGCTGQFEPGSVVVHHQWRTRRGQIMAQYGYGVGTGACVVKRWRLDGMAPTAVPSAASPARDQHGRVPPLPWGPLLRRGGRRIVWEDGLRTVDRALRAHFEMAAVGATVKTVGEVCGAIRARRAALDRSGRFVTS